MTFASVYQMFTPLTLLRKQRFWEWFSGNELKSYWRKTTIGSSTGTMGDAIDGGYLITTGNLNNDRIEIDFNNKRQYAFDASVFLCVSKLGETTESISVYGLLDNTKALFTSGVHWGMNTTIASTKFLLSTQVTNTSSTTDTDTNSHVFKGELNGSNLTGSIDGVDSTVITTNLPTAAMQPHIDRQSKAATAKTMNTTYFEAVNT